ncbi:hypothetical protein D3C78_1491880 [compost metagenome]
MVGAAVDQADGLLLAGGDQPAAHGLEAHLEQRAELATTGVGGELEAQQQGKELTGFLFGQHVILLWLWLWRWRRGLP